jgi:3-methyladenine DNA glycosylase AlkC
MILRQTDTYEANSTSLFINKIKQNNPSLIHIKMSGFAKDRFGYKLVSGHAVRTLKTKEHLQNNKYYSKFVK